MARRKETFAQIALSLGTELARAVQDLPEKIRCVGCGTLYETAQSKAVLPQSFCSVFCEQEFVRARLKSLTLEDCLLIQSRLEKLFENVDAAKQPCRKTAAENR